MRFRGRLVLLYVVFCAAIGVVWLRSAQMILLDGEEWTQRARAQRQRPERLDAMRGSIVSADGVVLAEDVCEFQLAVVGWEWQRRRRARCTACGLLHFQRHEKHLPRRCGCAARWRRGGEGKRTDAYPRDGGPRPATTLEELPPGNLQPLEAALELEPGTLKRLADARVAEIDDIVKAYRRSLLGRSDDSDFLIDDKVRLRRNDLLLRPFVVVDDIPEAAVRLVELDESGQFRGFRVQTTLRRRYPLGDFAPQLLGFTSVIRSSEEYERLHAQRGDQITHSTRVGRTGLERAYNWFLHGQTGSRVMELEPQGSFTRVVEHRPPRAGGTLRLSLSAAVSRDVERILEDAGTPQGYLPGGRPSGGFVAMDAETGEILLWGEAPRFDLNEDLATLYDPKRTQAVADRMARVWEPRHPIEGTMDLETWRAQLVKPVPLGMSRVGQVAVEPGSTFKPLIALGLLQSGAGLSHEGMTCRHGGGMPGCHSCGTVYLEEAISRSCNRYFAWSLRDGPGWSVNRYFVANLMAQMGIGRHPGEVLEWSSGQWLWNWYDFPVEKAVVRAQQRLTERMGARAPVIHLGRHPRVPATIGGDLERLGSTLEVCARHVATRTGTRKILLHVTREATEGRQVVLRFGIRAGTQRAWHVVPDPRVGREALPARLRSRYPTRAGIAGHLASGGTLWFSARFARRMGRDGPEAAPVIRPDDGRNVAIGQGPVLATPLQMARAVAVIANGGTLVTPHVARQGARPLHTADRARVQLAPEHLRRVRAGMFDAVDSGTARHAPWSTVPATVYGKTGTAQVGRSWKPWDADEDDAPWHHWFVGFAEAPGRRTIAFACVLHARTEAGASMTAVPATARILERWYRAAESYVGRGE